MSTSSHPRFELDAAGPPVFLATDAAARTPAVAGTSLSTRGVIEACFRQRSRLLWIIGLTLLCTILACVLTPKRYQATMQLIVLNTRDNSVISSNALDVAKPVSDITDSDVNSQAELVRSHDVLRAAVLALHNGSAPEQEIDREIERLSRKIDVGPIRQSSILNVSYVGRSPEEAQRTLQAVASSYVEEVLHLRRPAQSGPLFKQLVEENRTKLAAAERNLADFKVSTGITALPEDEAGLLRQLEGSTTTAATLAAQTAEADRRARRALEERVHYPERITTQQRSTPNQRAVEDLTTKLVELENRRTSLLTGYLPTERNVVEVDHQIATVRDEIAHQTTSAAVEQTTDVNPIGQSLEAQFVRSQIDASALAAQRRTVEEQRARYRTQLNALEGHAAEYQALQKHVLESQQNFDLAVQKRDQAELDDALDRQRILNVGFAARPSASSLPIQPKPRLYLLLGTFAALFFALGLAVLSELNRNTIYSPSELEALTGVLTLGSVPLAPDHADRFARPKRAHAFGTGSDEVDSERGFPAHAAETAVSRSQRA